jgi:RNA polymerase sigma-70 factor (ECF subfamily)
LWSSDEWEGTRTSTKPSQTELLELHAELLASEPAAPARIAARVLPWLIARVRVDHADPAQIESACGWTLAAYLQDPEQYRPEKGTLLAWLALDADGNVRNELASAVERREHPGAEVVELHGATRNVFMDPAQVLPVEDEALDAADPYDLPPQIIAAVRAEADHYSEEDLAVIGLLGEGVRETAAFAAVLGISHLPVASQRKEVKRCKDRLLKSLERLRDRVS